MAKRCGKAWGNKLRRHRHATWLERRSRRKFLNPRIAIYRPRRLRFDRTSLNDHNAPGVRVTKGGLTELILPDRMNFDDDYEATVSYLRLIRDAARGKVHLTRLGFESLTQISAAAALVLASEVDRWSQRLGRRLRAAVDTWDPEIKRLLCGMGYFELLKLPRPSMLSSGGSVTFVEFVRGTSEPRDNGSLAKQLRTRIEAIIGPGLLNRPALYEGLSEAITNVVHHAYPGDVLPTRLKQWWLSASYDTSINELCVLVYDQGVGIPETLPARWANFEMIREVFHLWKDARKIAAAMHYGRSSTDLPERGKGLRNLEHFAKVYENGRLTVRSNHGLYQVGHNEKGELAVIMKDYENSIGGTLIEWSVILQ